MKVVVIHGQAHKGSTYNVTKSLLEYLNCEEANIQEFRVNGMGQCVGCFQCIETDEEKCPHRDLVEPIIIAMEEADVIITESPTYVMSMTGQLKSFFDHLGYRWIAHRPNGGMRKKIGVVISTTAGSGAKKTTKDMKEQLEWLAVGKIYQLPFVVSASSWDRVKDEKKEEIDKKVSTIAKKVNALAGKSKPSLKVRLYFLVMRQMQLRIGYSKIDVDWWKANGWI